MALRIVADKLDELPEGLRDAAKQEGAAFVVSALKEGWAIEDVTGLRKVLTEERHGRKQAEKALAAFDGLAPESAGEAREALEKFKAGQLKGSKELDDWKASYEAKTREERAKLEAKLQKRTEALRERMLRGELAPVIAAKGGADSMDAILTLAQQHVRMEEGADGEIKVSLVDKGGKPLLTNRSASGDAMGFDELVEQMRDAPATKGLFKVPASGGTGSSSQTGAGRAVGMDITKMSPTELVALGNQSKAAR